MTESKNPSEHRLTEELDRLRLRDEIKKRNDAILTHVISVMGPGGSGHTCKVTKEIRNLVANMHAAGQEMAEMLKQKGCCDHPNEHTHTMNCPVTKWVVSVYGMFVSLSEDENAEDGGRR